MANFTRGDRDSPGGWHEMRLTFFVRTEGTDSPMHAAAAIFSEDFRKLAGIPDPPETTVIDAPCLEVTQTFFNGTTTSEVVE